MDKPPYEYAYTMHRLSVTPSTYSTACAIVSQVISLPTLLFFIYIGEGKCLVKWPVVVDGEHYAEKILACEPLPITRSINT